MEENRRREPEYGPDIKIKTPLMSKLENFWYYYKWHTIVALFCIFVFLICTLQMCSKVPIDAYIVYAGEREIGRTVDDGDIPEYNRLVSALKEYVPDYNSDGETSVSLITLFALSEEEIKKYEGEVGKEINYTLLREDAQTLGDRLHVGEYYIYLLSPDVYLKHRGEDDNLLFVPIAGYVNDGTEVDLYDECAVKLSSTRLYRDSAAVREILPEDTLLVMRRKSAVGGIFGGVDNDERFARAEEILCKMLGE